MNREQYLIWRFGIDTSKKAPYFVKLSRWKELPYLLADMECVEGVEVGTEGGKFAECLLRKIPQLKLHCVDCWEGYEGYRANMQSQQAEYYQKAIQRLAPYSDRCVLIKKYSMDALSSFEDESLDFVYIDGNHDFVNVTKDIDGWTKKVKKGGIIAGHDFTRNDVGYEKTQVKDVVQAWTYANGIKTWFVTKEGDRSPSWFWVKGDHV